VDDGSRGRRPASGATAHERALRLLTRRPLSEAELRLALARAGHGPPEIEAETARLREAGYLDDRRLAEQVLRAHARRGHGPRRAREELERRGVTPETIRAAGAELQQEPGLDRAADLRARLQDWLAAERRPLDDRGLRRVYNRLLRAGFEELDVNAALEPFFLSEREVEPDAAGGDVPPAPRRRRTTGYDDDLT